MLYQLFNQVLNQLFNRSESIDSNRSDRSMQAVPGCGRWAFLVRSGSEKIWLPVLVALKRRGHLSCHLSTSKVPEVTTPWGSKSFDWTTGH